MTPKEQEEVIAGLTKDQEDNEAFMNVINTLKRSEELKPLIFDHLGLLRTLRGIS